MALSLQHTNISRDPRRFYVEEFPIRFTDAMGMKLTVPFRIFAAYDVGGQFDLDRYGCDLCCVCSALPDTSNVTSAIALDEL